MLLCECCSVDIISNKICFYWWFMFTGTSCLLQGVHPKFCSARDMECDHVPDSRAGELKNILVCITCFLLLVFLPPNLRFHSSGWGHIHHWEWSIWYCLMPLSSIQRTCAPFKDRRAVIISVQRIREVANVSACIHFFFNSFYRLRNSSEEKCQVNMFWSAIR